MSVSGAGLENEYVAVKFGEKGEVASIRNAATGREIVKCGRLKGYLMTTWKRTQPENRKAILDSVDLLSDEM